MSRGWKISGVLVALLLAGAVLAYRSLTRERDPFRALFDENCAVCHGDHLEGSPQGSPLVGTPLVHGESLDEVRRAIAEGFEANGMPSWSSVLTEGQISSLAIYVAERRTNFDQTDFHVADEIAIPQGVLETERHRFRIEVFATGLDPLPFSIAPLPDGGFLLTEKTRGLSIVSPDGKRGELIEGAPKAYGYGHMVGDLELPRWTLRPKVYLGVGMGWLMDVALHPDYATNGWIYLHYGDRCQEGCGGSKSPVSMNRLDRGRIRDGRWVDAETIWRADEDMYTSVSDRDAGGRIAFDGQGHVFISIGVKGGYYQGVQDLDFPYGKVHRVNDDGSIPVDNPFVVLEPGSATPDPRLRFTRQTIWTYGHRSPQGLEFDRRTGELWGTEHGPRGGDEVNLLLPGRNYGWPLTSKGLNYEGTPVDYGKELGLEFDYDDIEQPVVDLTPSPAVSSFVFYEGEAFPEWQGAMLVGSLKGSRLFRIEVENGRLVHMETLIEHLARIRDIEVGYDGLVYLLLESTGGSQIVRLVPAP